MKSSIKCVGGGGRDQLGDSRHLWPQGTSSPMALTQSPFTGPFTQQTPIPFRAIGFFKKKNNKATSQLCFLGLYLNAGLNDNGKGTFLWLYLEGHQLQCILSKTIRVPCFKTLVDPHFDVTETGSISSVLMSKVPPRGLTPRLGYEMKVYNLNLSILYAVCLFKS